MNETLLIIIFLLAANGFFVAAEFALVKVRKHRLQAMAADKRFGAALAERMRADVEQYLAACQLGITMASLGLGWVGELAVAALLEPVFAMFSLPEKTVHTISFLIGFILFSSLHIVIGEQVPKTWAIRVAEDMVRWCAHTLYAFYLIVFPLNWLLNKAAASILAMFNVQPETHADVFTDREIQGIIASSSEHGEMEQSKAERLSNLFGFEERTVGRVMIPRSEVTMLDLSVSVEDNLAILHESSHSRLPLINGRIESPVGVILVKELYKTLLLKGAIPWDDLQSLSREPLVIPESHRIAMLFETMRGQRDHMALVVDEYGQFIGLVTLEDLIEEIVGEISDETDKEDNQYVINETDEGWQANGLTPLTDIEKTIGLVVPDSLNANTVSGLLMQNLGRMPEVGDLLKHDHYEISVISVESNHVGEVAIRDIGEEENNSEDTET